MVKRTNKDTTYQVFGEAIEIMARLRSPEGGCPWDLAQSYATIAPHTIEEAYEVAAAIESGDRNSLKEELGDLFFQVAFHSQMAAEEGAFDIVDVIDGLNRKMVDRHPHVFGDANIDNAKAQTEAWESMKAKSRAEAAAATGTRPSALDGVILPLPALTRAQKIQSRAARVGFDWENADQVLPKLEEEIAELREALSETDNQAKVEEELGDILFSIVNLARHLNLDAESALRRATSKFERRFRILETRLQDQGKNLAELPLDQLEAAWQYAKSSEK